MQNYVISTWPKCLDFELSVEWDCLEKILQQFVLKRLRFLWLNQVCSPSNDLAMLSKASIYWSLVVSTGLSIGLFTSL